MIKSSDYPFLFVNIGSGVSILKIDANKKFERITGTSVGGGIKLLFQFILIMK